jgi:hypothetical protein
MFKYAVLASGSDMPLYVYVEFPTLASAGAGSTGLSGYVLNPRKWLCEVRRRDEEGEVNLEWT